MGNNIHDWSGIHGSEQTFRLAENKDLFGSVIAKLPREGGLT